ncbi:MAG: proline hydroxylase [Nitrospinae bacterium CG11_big_fil_rev_8_21_14_0_20_56_8]|nr:MAG: proline hydroxylase [Nitrospinae bacterium CG11_big_fil_rev_8_21_14_0_20_56_8]
MKCLLPEATTRYREAAPFPHIVLDDFFDPEILNRVLEEFPSNKDIQWIQYYDTNQKKLANENEAGMGLFTRYVLYSLNSATFLKFLEEMTGISNLISDPSFRGGGLHNIYRGGKLGVHADFNKHEKFNIDRRLNLLLYLNKDWKEEYGGHIELWDRDMRQCHKRILPIFNRVVVFTTTDCSYHGHPDPLDCPDHMSRKSLALYYYTNGRPEEEIGQHHSTLFKLRPGEAVESTASIKAQKWWRRLKQKWGS